MSLANKLRRKTSRKEGSWKKLLRMKMLRNCKKEKAKKMGKVNKM